MFRAKNGIPMNRFNIWHDIRCVCDETQVAEEKANPRCLRRLYNSTHVRIEKNISARIAQVYEQVLDEEKMTIGWDA